jgi:hypothetical protein
MTDQKLRKRQLSSGRLLIGNARLLCTFQKQGERAAKRSGRKDDHSLSGAKAARELRNDVAKDCHAPEPSAGVMGMILADGQIC